ncbi:MAG: uroporphyrinogen-III synthase [Bacteroidales bacterium]|nr:uroporphyrinogen-III synthase [Bacteroidales bacterium]
MILQGKVFISTVSTHKSFEIRNIFEPLGATVVDFPMTEFMAVDQTPAIQSAICQIEKFNWIIFTSANGVKHFYRLLNEIGKVSKIPSGVKIAAVGVKTALELENAGRKADYSGSGNTAENLVNELIEKESLQNCNILLPLGNLAPDTLQARLSKIANVTRIDVYKTIKAQVADNEPIERIKNNRYDLVIFTSPSGVDNFADAIGPENVNPELRVASIGKVTSRAVEQHGLTCLVTAAKSTYEGLANEIVNYYTIN